jgi:hypothetical protein
MTQQQNLLQLLTDAANRRRLELLPYVSHSTQNRVQTGPFKGMTIVPKSSWGDGDTGAKWLGVYEDELHDFVEDAISRKPDCLINIGCAEGYYIVGLSLRLPGVKGIAVDVSPAAVSIVDENAAANGVDTIETVNQTVDTDWLQQQCSQYQSPFLVVDCEGAEQELLDPEKAPALKHASILVESHDCVIPGLLDVLTDRFLSTHDIQVADQKYKDPYQFDFLKPLSDCDKWALVHEGRPSSMSWLYMTPKSK